MFLIIIITSNFFATRMFGASNWTDLIVLFLLLSLVLVSFNSYLAAFRISNFLKLRRLLLGVGADKFLGCSLVMGWMRRHSII